MRIEAHEAEHEPDRRCVAAPIRNAAGRVFAAISVTGPMRRVTPEQVANAVLWLVSPGAESMNGQAISVSGGEI